MVIALVGGAFSVSFFYFSDIGFWYLLPSFLTKCALLPLRRRWDVAIEDVWLFSALWPMSALAAPFFVVSAERERRERIVREIMET